MRFKLEKEDILKNNCSNLSHYTTTTKLRVNNETFSLPTTSYVIIDERTDQRFIVIDHNREKRKVLKNLLRGLQLKLERVENDYKLALVTASDNSYYYYYDNKDIIIDIIDRIPKNYTNGAYVNTYNPDRCSAYYELLEKNKVLIDPKDIITNENINHILEDLKKSPDKRLEIQIGDFLFKESQSMYKLYKSAQVYDTANSEIGILNNIISIFDRRDNNFKLFPFHEIEGLKAQDSYFTAKKLGNNYVGCISYENSTCKNFYSDSFGYEYDNSSRPYPYYYNLENFGNFLDVGVNNKEYIDLEEKIEALKSRIETLDVCSTVKEACPHYKQIEDFLVKFRDSMEKRLINNDQQRAFVNTEKILADNKQPRSFMSHIAPPSGLSTINQTAVGYLR